MRKRATSNIAVPTTVRDWIAERVSEGDYESPGEYVGDLVRDDRMRRAADRIDALLLEGLDSGPSKRMTANDWKRIRAELARRIAKPSSDLG